LKNLDRSDKNSQQWLLPRQGCKAPRRERRARAGPSIARSSREQKILSTDKQIALKEGGGSKTGHEKRDSLFTNLKSSASDTLKHQKSTLSFSLSFDIDQ